jgi:hypothetical protein
MKNAPLLLLFCLLGLFQHALAQPLCGFDVMHAKRMKEDPQYRKNIQAGETSIRTYIQQHPGLLIRRTPSQKIVTGSPAQTLGGSYTIPVVIHVISTGGDIGTIYNPTDAQILGAIDYLNAVYNGSYPGTAGAGNLGIQFVMARRDPNCNPTNGINRVDGSGVAGYVTGGVNNSTTLGTNEINIKNLSRWDNTQYYNVWIVNKIDGNDGTSGQFIAGYAYLPGASATIDGIVMLATQMVSGQKTLPHEIGHAFFLYHPFQGSTDKSQCPVNGNCNTDGDLVCDTDPISENINSSTGVIDFTCRTGTNPCTGTPYADATESNYMNYTNCFDQFTLGQAARMQATAVSSYRVSLTTSLGGSTPSASGCIPKIDFELTGDRQTEMTAASSGCRSYKDYSYNMVIGSGPSATTTATLTTNSGTAIQGLDFDLSTNGSFTSASQQLSFPAGSTVSQPFTIRVYDDASVNGTRNITLGFTVNNNGGNAVAGDGRPNFTMTIDDNDVAPTPGVLPTNIATVGTFSSGVTGAPLNATQQSQRTQFLYKASELTAAGIPAGPLSAIAFQVNTKHSTRPFTNLQIKMGTASVNYLYDGSTITLGSSMIVVKSLDSFATVAGTNTFTFDTPWTWDGTSNVVVEVCYDNGTAAPTDAADQFVFYPDGGGNNQYNTLYQDNIDCDQSFSALTAPGGNGLKPRMFLTYGVPTTGVQSTVNSSQSQYLGPNADVYFYDQTNGLLMARIQNLTNFNYGCTQVVIDRAGTNATQFWNTNTTNYLMDKTFHVLPTTNNASGSYNLTLYYSQAEIQGWQTLTGQSLAAIQLVKVPGQISMVTAANPNGAGSVTVVTPTIGTLGSNTSLTYNFTNGFSGFGAGIPSFSDLPIGLLKFSGRLEGNNAILTWSTSYEQNNKGFEVDRSVDGTNFSAIGFVSGAGNSTTQKDYTFTDPSLLGDSNYYQLKQIDLDGRITYSNIVLLNKTHLVPYLTISPNPFTSDLDILFGHVPTEKVQIRLLDIAGRELWRQTGIQSDGSRLHVGLSGSSLSAGVYLLEVLSNSGIRIQRVIRK